MIIANPNEKAAPANAFYRPIHWDELKAYMDRLPIGPHPEFEHYRPGHPEIAYLEKK